MGQDEKKCSFINKSGKRCKAFKQTDSLYCFTHDPSKEQERAVAVSQGGKSKGFITNLAPFKIDGVKDIPKAIAKVLNEVRKGGLTPAEANSMIYGLSAMVKAYEITGAGQKSTETEQDALVLKRHNAL